MVWRGHPLGNRILGTVDGTLPQVTKTRGTVATYGEAAAKAGYPHAPRLAGYALYALPEGTPLPWHRVVGAGGRLSLARLSPDGALTQRMRLEREGLKFDARGRVVTGRLKSLRASKKKSS